MDISTCCPRGSMLQYVYQSRPEGKEIEKSCYKVTILTIRNYLVATPRHSLEYELAVDL